MATIKTSWFWWWGWSPEKLENWLEHMEAQGWNLFQVDYGGIRFKFKKGIPRRIRFGTDYQPEGDDDYLSIFQDDGWELTWFGAGGWYLWTKSYGEKRPEIFTDNLSLIHRNNRMTKLLAPLFGLIIFVYLGLILMNREEFRILIIIYTLVLGLYSYIFYHILKANRKLKDQIKD